MTDQTQAIWPVLPEDRDAFRELVGLRDEMSKSMAAGGTWDADPRMQLLARHRQAHSLPGDVGMCVLLADVELQLKAARIFVTSREKMHPHGVELYDQQITAVARALEALAPTTPADLGLTVQDQWKADASLVESSTALEDGDGYLYEPTGRDGAEQAKAALQSALTALADDSTPIVRRVARTRIRHALAALTLSAVSGDAFGLTDDEAWEQLVNFDDRTSPAEYPDMALITREELSHFMRSSAVCELGDILSGGVGDD